MKLLIATGNPSKFNRYRALVAGFPGIDVRSLEDADVVLSIQEDGTSAQANAEKKASAYAQAAGLTTLGVDEALYVDALPDEEQPGTNDRRYLGYSASDEDLLAAFLEKVKSIPRAERSVTWVYAMCLAKPDGRCLGDRFERQAILLDTPTLPILPGYPLSSILFDPVVGKVHRDITQEEELTRFSQAREKLYTLLQAIGDLEQRV